MDSVIDQYYSECRALLDVINDSNDISTANMAEALIQKHLTICIASHFEAILCDAIVNYYTTISNEHTPAVSFLKSKAIKRQYHTWFDWKVPNANAFFSLFGQEFRQYMNSRIKSDALLERAVRSFMELGNDRNELIHNDLATSSSDKTVEEIFQKYREASRFVELFPNVLYEFVNDNS